MFASGLWKRIARQKCLKLEQDVGGIFATYPSPEFASLEISELISIWYGRVRTREDMLLCWSVIRFEVYSSVGNATVGGIALKSSQVLGLKAERCTGAWNGMITCHSSWKKRREHGGWWIHIWAAIQLTHTEVRLHWTSLHWELKVLFKCQCEKCMVERC